LPRPVRASAGCSGFQFRFHSCTLLNFLRNDARRTPKRYLCNPLTLLEFVGVRGNSPGDKMAQR
jgi:hypothetical protein